MVCWSLLLIGIIFTVNRQRFVDWLSRTRNLWMATGLLVISMVILGSLFALNSLLIQISGIDDTLRGGLDYRELAFYDDGQPMPSAQDFWQEQAQTRVRWSPYTYWVVMSFRAIISISTATAFASRRIMRLMTRKAYFRFWR
ncbi:MAG: hypothetical protein Q9P01_15975 [Anaerolineae bacterium]|nr:hypothetical protein [Anaerolineae bacterium]